MQKDRSIFSLMNISFQRKNNDDVFVPEESPINQYLTKDHILVIEIINKNTIICDKKKYDIKDYIQKINNNNQNEFLDDVMVYNHCEKCKNDLNKYFCKNCNENICNKCYEKCKNEKHDFINLYEMKDETKGCLKIIKKFLSINIISLKEGDKNIIKEENNEDFLLIVGIISQDYINFFHLSNIERFFKISKNI